MPFGDHQFIDPALFQFPRLHPLTTGGLTVKSGAMNVRRRHTVLAVIVGLLAVINTTWAELKPKSFYFTGRLIAVDPAARTFTIQAKKRALTFSIDVHHCWITRDGSMKERTLRWAKLGDAVMCKVKLIGGKAVVEWVEFTSKPEIGVPVPGKPGFVRSPYITTSRVPMDVRNFPHGAMVMDDVVGKIFLVP